MQAASRHLMRIPKQHILFPTPIWPCRQDQSFSLLADVHLKRDGQLHKKELLYLIKPKWSRNKSPGQRSPRCMNVMVMCMVWVLHCREWSCVTPMTSHQQEQHVLGLKMWPFPNLRPEACVYVIDLCNTLLSSTSIKQNELEQRCYYRHLPGLFPRTRSGWRYSAPLQHSILSAGLYHTGQWRHACHSFTA